MNMKNVNNIVMAKIDNELTILRDQTDVTDYVKYREFADRYDGGIHNYKDGYGETFEVSIASELLGFAKSYVIKLKLYDFYSKIRYNLEIDDELLYSIKNDGILHIYMYTPFFDVIYELMPSCCIKGYSKQLVTKISTITKVLESPKDHNIQQMNKV